MDRLVYLFELDSVRNSEQEVERGQQALYEEIVLNGNSVVLSFNQLSDSEAFLYAVKDPKSYEQILQLFEMEVLRFSPFETIRTPSQYIQGAIEKGKAVGNDNFIFSALPVKCEEKELLEEIQRALRFSDLSVLQESLEECRSMQKKTQDLAEVETLREQEKKLDYMIRYIRLILQLSVQDLKKNPRKDERRITFVECYRRVCQMLKTGIAREYMEDEEAYILINALLPDAWERLSKVHDTICRNSVKSNRDERNNRTNWIRILNEVHAPDAYLAEAIVDLCYNYAVESSMVGISRHYTELKDVSFERDFSIRLQQYWRQYQQAIHLFGDRDQEQVNEYQIQQQDWEQVVRVIQTNQEYRKKRKQEQKIRIDVYETDYEEEKKEWNKMIWKSFWRSGQIAFGYLVAFVVFDLFLGFLGGEFESAGLQLHFPAWVMQIVDTILFGIIASLVSTKFGIPDILESIRNIFIYFADGVAIRNKRQRIAYHRGEHENQKGE